MKKEMICKICKYHYIEEISLEPVISKLENILKENQELKEQLEKWNNQLKFAEEMITIQRQDGNYNYDEYMLGMYNGMEYIASLFRINEPKIISGKDIKFLHNSHKNQQKEFIKYLEKRYKDVTNVIGSYGSNTDMLYGKKDMIEEILQKYKSIIGDDK